MSNVVKLRAGDSFNLRTGSVIRNDRTEPDNTPRETTLANMLRRNNLPALAWAIRNNTRP